MTSRRRPFPVHSLSLGESPIGSDVIWEVADIPEVATGGGDASVHVKLDRQYVHGRVL